LRGRNNNLNLNNNIHDNSNISININNINDNNNNLIVSYGGSVFISPYLAERGEISKSPIANCE